MEEPQKKNEDAQELSRREALKIAAGGFAGVFIVGIGDKIWALGGALPQDQKYNPKDHTWVYVIDIRRCIGCGSCVRACKRENDVPDERFRTWVERYKVMDTEGEVVMIDSPNGGHDGFEPVTPEDVKKAFFVPKMCNHCKFSPCTQLCPVGASYRTPDGVMLVDEKRCIGCSYCVQACPYGSRFIHPKTHTASKCTLCYHRITKGLRPACVEACPRGARMFGDLQNPDDPVRQIIETQETNVLKPELHTGPHCRYLGMSKEVR